MPSRSVTAPTTADHERAWEHVSAVLPPTPLLPTALAPGAFLKAETQQPTGSFKVRGALAALTALPGDAAAVTASAGNHGLAMAYAATLTGTPVTVVVSTKASPAKVAKMAAYPITLVRYGDDFDAAEAHSFTLPGWYVSAYNDPHVIAGQATIGRELDAQAPGPLTVVAPVGGGGLVAGLALWAEGRGDVTVVGVESAVSRAVSAAVTSGRIEPQVIGDTIADGIAGNIEAGCVTPDLIRGRAELTAVTDAEIHVAMRWLFTEHGLVVEGAGACGVAAMLAGKVTVNGRLIVVLSGRNITIPTAINILAEN
ncbi:threonine/serine dehydratase [Nonomuraea sp. NPDC050022]|uniref:threonine/serine dehydratase n=1 Tax=Nonomuraea sp. NPDC050022 TaxID=3364358 RepID=UPI0037897CCD